LDKEVSPKKGDFQLYTTSKTMARRRNKELPAPAPFTSLTLGSRPESL